MSAVPTVQELEHTLALAAYIVVRHGEAYAPILDRLEKELADAQSRESHTDRARGILAKLSMTMPASALPAIRPAH